jgi:hypothetical protein
LRRNPINEHEINPAAMITSIIGKFYSQSIAKAVDFFKRRTIASLFLLFVAGISIATINMIHLSSELINNQALQS